MSDVFSYGIDELTVRHAEWLRGVRAGLAMHPASVGCDGTPSAVLVRGVEGCVLACLFGPEHGVAGRGGAGEDLGHARHPEWGIPIFSLYGETRRPTPEMLDHVDALIFDLQDLGARPYTYVATLRGILETAAAAQKTVIVADRPIPLPQSVDGPMLDPAFESFVGSIPSPVAYAMTPGETALWLKRELSLELDLRVAPMRNYSRTLRWPGPASRWIPPSPAIRSLECAQCFPATVFFEAIPALDHARKTAAPFRQVGAPWLEARGLHEALAAMDLPGVEFSLLDYEVPAGEYAGQTLKGVRLNVTNTEAFRPVQTGLAIMASVQALHGPDRIWRHPGTREEFFDKLMGTDEVRKQIQAGLPAAEIAAGWTDSCAGFLRDREDALLYR